MASRKKISDLEATMSLAQIERAKQIVQEERELSKQLHGQPTASDAIQSNEEMPTTVRLGAADRMYLTMLARRENKSFSQLVREIVQEGLAKRLELLTQSDPSKKPSSEPDIFVLGPSEIQDIARTLGNIVARLAPGLGIISGPAVASAAGAIGYIERGHPTKDAGPTKRPTSGTKPQAKNTR